MGNKNTTENKSSQNLKRSFPQQPKAEYNPPENQTNQIYRQNPLQLAKDEQGRLHPKWSEIVKKCQQKHKTKTYQYVKKIAQQTNRIGSQCSKQFSQNQTKLMECVEIVAEPIKKIQKKGQQKIMGLGKTANICLLSNKKEDKCIQEVRKVLHGCLQETLKQMKKIKVQLQ